MVKWSFEVRHGDLSILPSALVAQAEEQRKLNVGCFLISEAGTLLNEPDKQMVHSIPSKAIPTEVIAGVSRSLAWLFDRLEPELDQDFRYNYLKVCFVNLHPIRTNETVDSGQMTTNFPELPETAQLSPEMQFHQMVTALRFFFSHVRGAVEIADWETESFACDWVSMTFNKIF